MKQSILMETRTSEVQDVVDPALGPHDVLVRTHLCGICASELHIWAGGGNTYPRRLGHEVAGEVVATGSAVTGTKVGDRVTGLFTQGFAELAVTGEECVLVLPAAVSYEAALGEPLACVISGIRRTAIELGDTVVIVGQGYMGLLCLQIIRLQGAARIIAIDVRAESLAAALQYGADEAYLYDEVYAALDISRGKPGKYGANVVVEVTGTQAGLTLAERLLLAQGTLSVVGYHQGVLRTVDMDMWAAKAVNIVSAHEHRQDFLMDCMRRGIALTAADRIQTAALVTHRFALTQVDAAFCSLAAKPPGFIKAIVQVVNHSVPSAW